MVTAPDFITQIRAALAKPGKGSSDFDLHPDIKLPEGRKLRPAAVLMPLIYEKDQLNLILTKRSSALRHHPGQIAFPGGKVDAEDETVTAAALREAHEEIGLSTDLVEVLGEMPTHETITGFTVTPVLGLIRQPFQVIEERGEVEEVFSVPFEHVVNPQHFQRQGRIWQGQMRYYETVPFGPYYIWGATARMLRALADRMAQ